MDFRTDTKRHNKKGWLALSAVSILGLAVAAFMPGAAYAQEQRMPGVVDRPSERPSGTGQPWTAEEKKRPELAEEPQWAGVSTTLKSVKFTGTLVISEKELQSAVAPYINKSIGGKEIAALKYDLTKLYYDKGYILVKVITPPQDLTSGVLEVAVYAGRIGDIKLDANTLNRTIGNAMIAGVKRGEVFNERKAETAVKNLDDLGRLKANLNLKPGQEFGTTDLTFTGTAVDDDEQRISIDNYGSELTGEGIATVELKRSNLLHLGETFGLTYRQSIGEGDLKTWGLNFKTPIGFRNVFFEANYLDSENEIGDYLETLNSTGETQSLGLALSAKCINTQQNQLGVRFGIDKRRHRTYIYGTPETDDHITQGSLQATYIRRTAKYVGYVGLKFTKGLNLWDADEKGEFDASRLNGNPKGLRIMPSFYVNYRVTEKDYIQVMSDMQFSSSKLLSSDLFAIGGYGSVRGFPLAYQSGETGYSATLEYGHRFTITPSSELSVGPFFDFGHVKDREDSGSTNKDSSLSSIGLGAELNAHIIKSGETRLRLDYAAPLGSYDEERVDNGTFYVRLSQTF